MRAYDFTGHEFSEAIAEAGSFRPSRRPGATPGGNLVLRTDTGHFRILEIGPADCLIESAHASGLRGRAEIFDGDRQVATCLITLAAPDGPYLRCAFKRRTPVAAGPARDFAP